MKYQVIRPENFERSSDIAKELDKEYFFLQKTLEYESLYYGDKYQLFIFVIADIKDIVIMPFTINKGEMSFFGSPLRLFVDKKMLEADRSSLVSFFSRSLQEVFTQYQVKKIIFEDHSFFINLFISKIAFPSMTINAVVDLLQNEETILKDIRKSYRSLINWGKRELKFDLIDEKYGDEELFLRMQRFHIDVAERETRSPETWKKQYEIIKAGKGFALFGYLNGDLVSAALILHGTKRAYYGVAVNDRDLMAQNKPLGHFLIYKSLMTAKEKGLETFDLGVVYSNNFSSKEKDIALFKKGFSSKVESRYHFELELTTETNPIK